MPRRRDPAAIDEDRFHRWLRSTLPRGAGGRLPLGDDTAAIPIGPGKVALLTTDALAEGTHFLARSPPAAIGRAAAAASLSDLAAKGGRPVALLVDLLVPPGTSERWLREVLRGAEREMARFGAHVVGGDTKPARTRAVVGTALGWAQSGGLAPRSGARPGDILAVTGAVGRGGLAALGLGPRPTLSALRALLDIRPRVGEGPIIARRAHAAMDTSDGLARSCRLLAESSGVRLEVDADALPIHPGLARRFPDGRRRREQAFFGGDYEILAALPPAGFRRARRDLLPLGCPFTAIGRVARGRGAFLRTADGSRAPMPAAGWRPFARAR